MSGRYIDISSWQPDTIDWARYKVWSAGGDGVSRVCLRVDQGTGTPDTLFSTHYARAKAAGIEQFIFYHFCYPWLNPGWIGAQEEVKSFMRYLGSALGPDDLVMLDAEPVNGRSGPADWHYDWLEMCAAIANLPFHRVAIYANSSYISTNLQDPRLAQFPLILAAWNNNPTPPSAPRPWTSLLAWQYTDKAIVSGVPEPVDADFFLQPPPAPPPNPNQEIGTALDAIEVQIATIRKLL